MSIETLLLIGLLVLLPLVERLIGLLRSRTGGTEADQRHPPAPQRPLRNHRRPAPEWGDEAADHPLPPDIERPPDVYVPSPVPPAPAPPLPAARSPVPHRAPRERHGSHESARLRRERQRGRETGGQLVPSATLDRARRQEVHSRARLGISSVGDLRRAVVLMTLLGPCRALQPSDDRERLG